MSDFIISPSQLTTVLKAVNAMIFTLGETGVDSLDPIPNSDVANALNVLDQTDLMLQSEGWHWNREDAFALSLTVDDEVALPDQTLSVTRAYWDTSGQGSDLDVVQRGDRLYDRANHTFTFEAAPVVDLIVRLPWDQIPQVARMYITLAACRTFHASLQERVITLRINEESLAQARVTLEQREDEWAKTNTTSSISVQNAIGSARRNRRGGI